MKPWSKKALIVACVALITCAAGSTRTLAQTVIAFNENGTPSSTPANSGLQGFEFTVNEDIRLISLGFYAQSLGGGDNPHVSLINLNGGATATPDVIYDTGNLLHPTSQITTQPGWNYISVGDPILLTPGNTYAVTAPAYFVEQYTSTSGFTYGSAISTPAFLYDSSTSFFGGGGYPGGWVNLGYNFTQLDPVGSDENIAADFEYTLVGPEPSTYLLLGIGLVMLMVIRHRQAVLVALHRQAALTALRQQVNTVPV